MKTLFKKINKNSHIKIIIGIIIILILCIKITNRNNALGSIDAHNLDIFEHTMRNIIEVLENSQTTEEEKEAQLKIYESTYKAGFHFLDVKYNKTIFLYDFNEWIYTSNKDILLSGDTKALEKLRDYQKLLAASREAIKTYNSYTQVINKIIPVSIIETDNLGAYYYVSWNHKEIIQRYTEILEN